MSPELAMREAPAQPQASLPIPQWAWMLFLLGIGLRVAQYARNRSLWYDEAVLALNLVHRPFLQLRTGAPGAEIGFREGYRGGLRSDLAAPTPHDAGDHGA